MPFRKTNKKVIVCIGSVIDLLSQKKGKINIKRNFLSDSLLKNMSATTAISRQIQVQSDIFLLLRKFKIFLDLISEQIQAFRYLISSSISANNALLRLLVKKRKWSLNFTKGSISQKAFKGFYPVEANWKLKSCHDS